MSIYSVAETQRKWLGRGISGNGHRICGSVMAFDHAEAREKFERAFLKDGSRLESIGLFETKADIERNRRKAVNAAINRSAPKIGGREAKMIHSILTPRGQS